MELTSRKDGNTLHITPEEEIHFDNYKDLEKIIIGEIDQGSNEIVLDLTNVDTLYSMTLGMFNNIANTIAKKGGKFALTNVNNDVRKVMKATRLDRIIEIR